MSYTIDVYRGRIVPTRRFLDFALYVCFFPQLIAGPIERASHLLPQIARARVYRLRQNDFFTGLLLIVWGLFKKCAISDNLSRVADTAFGNPEALDGGALLVATYAFAFQIFFDFSAYSDIARGSASLFGIKLVRNFRLPYLAREPSDFWRRWHVSLSEWIRDYLYIPLGGDRRGRSRTLINLTVTMALAGLWHGAAWHFCVWGIFHGILLVIYRITRPLVSVLSSGLPSTLRSTLAIAVMFHLTCLGWVLFRAESLADAGVVLRVIAAWIGGGFEGLDAHFASLSLFFAFFAIMVFQEHRRVFESITNRPFGYAVLLGSCIAIIALLMPEEAAPFIYFQF